MDHYRVLGVSPQAGHEEIRAAYLRVMRAHHPDHRPGDPVSAERARQANEAWAVLGDGAKRASYDRLRAATAAAAVTPRARRHDRVAHGGVSAAGAAAYSATRRQIRRAFSIACLKVAVAVCALGLLLLATFTG
ncbi:MAG TPA: J domain-containing protein [Egibacteraceae bacterium]